MPFLQTNSCSRERTFGRPRGALELRAIATSMKPKGLSVQTTDELRPHGRVWLNWSLFFVAAYLIISLVGWRRTLIGTEIWALYHAGQPLSEQLQAIRADLVHPPLMYLLERLWFRAFGQSDGAAKALALLVNLPTFFLFTWLAHRITPHWRLASFLFLSVYLKIGSTPDLVRMYGLGLLLTVGAMVLWEKWNEKPSNGTLIAWSFVALLLIYTHLFGTLLLVSFAVTNWLCGPRRWAFTLAALIPAFAFLPWFLYVLPVYQSRGLADNVAWVPKQFSVSLGILAYGLLGEFPVRYLPAQVVIALLAGLLQFVLLMLACRMAWRLWPPSSDLQPATRWFWAAGLLAYIPLALIVFFSIGVTPALHWRFVLGILPAYWLFVVLVCEASGRLARALLLNVTLAWAVLNVGAAFARMDIPSAPRQAAVLLAREQQPSDVILCQNSCNEIYWELTHHFGRGGDVEFLAPQPVLDRLSVVRQADLDAIDSQTVGRIWLFADKGVQHDSFVRSIQQRGFALDKIISIRDNLLLLFTRPTAATLEQRPGVSRA